MTTENKGAEMLAESITSGFSKVTQDLKSEFKSVGDNIVLGLKSIEESKAKEEVKSLEAKLSHAEEELKSLRSGQGVGSEAQKQLEEKSVKDFASAVLSNGKVKLENKSAIAFFDNSSAGLAVRDTYRGEVNLNRQPLNKLFDYVDILPAMPVAKGDSVWDGYDETLVDINTVNEADGAPLSENVKFAEIKINYEEYTAKMTLTRSVLAEAQSGNALAVGKLSRNLTSLDNKFTRNVIKAAYRKIADATKAGKIQKVITSVAETPVITDENAIAARRDLLNLVSNLKTDYVPRAAIGIDRTFLNGMFSQPTTDGHLALEIFEVAADGAVGFKTPEGVIPVFTFDHEQFGDYTTLAAGNALITSGYNLAGTGNAGKILAILADFREGYKVAPSSLGEVGYDNTFASKLSGSIPAGKFSWIGHGIVVHECFKVLYSA